MKIQRAKRRQIRMPVGSAVRGEPLNPEHKLPWLIRPGLEAVDLVAWAAENRGWIQEKLDEHGALLFRDFEVGGLEKFQHFIEAVSGSDLLEYVYRSTPRTEVQGNIYTSTEYPADQEIPLHNENAYSRSWPMKVFFFCEKKSEEGGNTPIVDSHEIFEAIDPEIRQAFIEQGVSYLRSYGEGADLSWQEVFQTEDRAEVEAFCQREGIELEWLGGDRLRTRQRCQAVARHPKSGKWLWFNQAHLFHVSSLAPEMQEAMLEVFDEEDLPRHAQYGNGKSIESEVLEEIRRVYREKRISFPWQQGDILLLDNMAVAHGREPFAGTRKIRVGMSGPIKFSEVETG